MCIVCFCGGPEEEVAEDSFSNMEIPWQRLKHKQGDRLWEPHTNNREETCK